MNTYADKTQENKSQSVASAVSEKQGGSGSTFQFVDNRPEAIQMLQFQEVANNNTQENTLQFVDNRPRAIIQRKLQEISDNHNAPKSYQTVQRLPVVAGGDDESFLQKVFKMEIQPTRDTVSIDQHGNDLHMISLNTAETCQLHIHRDQHGTVVAAHLKNTVSGRRHVMSIGDAQIYLGLLDNGLVVDNRSDAYFRENHPMMYSSWKEFRGYQGDEDDGLDAVIREEYEEYLSFQGFSRHPLYEPAL
tara:strand:+ start:1801 stop:2541 length:741 start_codon:yes stop_codon:yes gene_type:complete